MTSKIITFWNNLLILTIPNLKILKKILESTHIVKTATEGYSALELASKEPIPDLILLDVSMPVMDGYEVLKELKDEAETNF